VLPFWFDSSSRGWLAFGADLPVAFEARIAYSLVRLPSRKVFLHTPDSQLVGRFVERVEHFRDFLAAERTLFHCHGWYLLNNPIWLGRTFDNWQVNSIAYGVGLADSAIGFCGWLGSCTGRGSFLTACALPAGRGNSEQCIDWTPADCPSQERDYAKIPPDLPAADRQVKQENPRSNPDYPVNVPHVSLHVAPPLSKFDGASIKNIGWHVCDIVTEGRNALFSLLAE